MMLKLRTLGTRHERKSENQEREEKENTNKHTLKNASSVFSFSQQI